ncbi:MAG: hypothetical protein ACREQN_12810 [Candidatus Binataceae bacterium]
MKLRIAIATAVGVALYPTLAFCAEGAEGAGSWLQLVFYIINFAIFIWILVKYAGPLVSRFFKNRAASIRESLDRAHRNLTNAQELANRAAERAAKLESEKAQISSDMADETIYQVGRTYDLAQETVARIKRDTAVTTTALREGAQRRLRETLARAASRIAREMVTRNFEVADQDRLLDGFMEKLRDEARR